MLCLVPPPRLAALRIVRGDAYDFSVARLQLVIPLDPSYPPSPDMLPSWWLSPTAPCGYPALLAHRCPWLDWTLVDNRLFNVWPGV